MYLILNRNYSYVWKDWYTGKNYKIPLQEAIAHMENYKIGKIKSNNCLTGG